MKVKVIENGDIIDVWEETPGIYRPKDRTYHSEMGPIYFETEDLDFNPYNDPRVTVLDEIIDGLKHIRSKYVNGETVGNDDWIIPAQKLRESIPLFMYNNPDKNN